MSQWLTKSMALNHISIRTTIPFRIREMQISFVSLLCMARWQHYLKEGRIVGLESFWVFFAYVRRIFAEIMQEFRQRQLHKIAIAAALLHGILRSSCTGWVSGCEHKEQQSCSTSNIKYYYLAEAFCGLQPMMLLKKCVILYQNLCQIKLANLKGTIRSFVIIECVGCI